MPAIPATEAEIFLKLMLLGIIASACYDLLRIIRDIIQAVKETIRDKIIHHPMGRRAKKKRYIFEQLIDIIFWITAAIIVFTKMMSLNNGITKGYVLPAIILGMLLYGKISNTIDKRLKLIRLRIRMNVKKAAEKKNNDTKGKEIKKNLT